MIKVAYHPLYAHPLPENHRFPMEKYILLKEELLHRGIISEDQILTPELLSEEDALLCHDQTYWEKLRDLKLSKQEIRASGFPLSQQLIDRERVIMQGSLDLASYALDNNSAGLNIAGGTHHAGPAKAEGFCLLNDLAIAVKSLYHQKRIQKALIIDLDVHQGNGTADIFLNHQDIITVSVHAKDNFPLRKAKSHIDYALDSNANDIEYLNLLSTELPKWIKNTKPDLVAYQCGVDILATDKLGRLNLTEETCSERDRLVFMACADNNLPVVAAMGGGYSPEIKTIVNAHRRTFEWASHYF